MYHGKGNLLAGERRSGGNPVSLDVRCKLQASEVWVSASAAFNVGSEAAAFDSIKLNGVLA